MVRPTNWGKTKERHQIRLTPDCWKHLQDFADANNLPSKTEAIEHLSRLAVRNYLSVDCESELVPINKEAIANLDQIAKQLGMFRHELVKAIALLPQNEILKLLQEKRQENDNI